MKLPDYAKHLGISYQTAWRWWKTGKLPHPARQTETGTVIVDYKPTVEITKSRDVQVAIYARVSSAENRANLDRQAERLSQYAIARGYTIVRVVKEIGNGINDDRKKLDQLLQLGDYDILLVEHKYRLVRFGSHYLESLLKRLGVQLEIVNLAENSRDELRQDLIEIVDLLSAQLYGSRKAKGKTKQIIAQLQSEEASESYQEG
jgi:putative resolvase